MFPCLDLLRLSLVNPVAAELLLAKHSEELLDLLLQNLTTHDKAANQMLALRSLANLFNTDKGEEQRDKKGGKSLTMHVETLGLL